MWYPPEPWRIDSEDRVVDANGDFVCDSVVGDNCWDDPGAMPDGAMERIVACVNHCKGMKFGDSDGREV